MVALSPSAPAEPTGGYVVARPAKTDAIGAILRASFLPGADEAGEEMKRLLASIDRSTRVS